jgi:hypothetical protein
VAAIDPSFVHLSRSCMLFAVAVMILQVFLSLLLRGLPWSVSAWLALGAVGVALVVPSVV